MVVEKPLTINPESTRQIAEAVKRTGRQVVVTHNYRYSPRNSALKEVIKNGSIGTPLSSRSNGYSTQPTARTTSAVGTATRPTPAAC